VHDEFNKEKETRLNLEKNLFNEHETRTKAETSLNQEKEQKEKILSELNKKTEAHHQATNALKQIVAVSAENRKDQKVLEKVRTAEKKELAS